MLLIDVVIPTSERHDVLPRSVDSIVARSDSKQED
jgi:hypothetical protein